MSADTMQWRVRHVTSHRYAEPSAATYSEARLIPLTTGDQVMLRARVEIDPSAWSQEYRDYWGTTVTAFEVTDEHEVLTITATSVVDTGPVDTGSVDVIDWEGLADPDLRDRHCEYLAPSETTDPDAGLAARLEELRAGSGSPADYVHAVGEIIRSEVQWLGAPTHVSSTAREVWESRAGVVHDLVHVALGALRQAGIPGRFVSGYLHPAADPALGETVATEPYAWLQWWDGDWTGYDVLGDGAIGPRHIAVGIGREFADVPALRGIYATRGEVDSIVEVELTRLS